MPEEPRTVAMNVKVRPSLRAAVEADRLAKGQALVEWIERAVQAALPQETQNAGGSR